MTATPRPHRRRRRRGALRVLDRGRADALVVEEADEPARVEHLPRRVERIRRALRRDRDAERADRAIEIDDADREPAMQRDEVARIDRDVDRRQRLREVLARRLVASGGLEPAVPQQIANCRS
jgi:hypothetical protein